MVCVAFANAYCIRIQIETEFRTPRFSFSGKEKTKKYSKNRRTEGKKEKPTEEKQQPQY